MVANASPDLILLDICLPGIDGFTTCEVIRKFWQVPIIMVTGSKSGRDKVRGLDLGADDYITKPFSEEELFARSRAVLRRSYAGGRVFRRPNLACGKALRFVNSINYAITLKKPAQFGKA
jgi:DNA-binding response OmpR family regulator